MFSLLTKRNTLSLHQINRVGKRFLSDDHSGPLLKTALYDTHVALGAKMVPFAGYSMPVQYQNGLIHEHLHCRSSTSLFDVAHMGPTRLKGKDALEFLETVIVADLHALGNGRASLSLITNEKGGIIDDCIISRITEESFFLVLNAGCKEKDIAHIKQKMQEFTSKGKQVSFELLEDSCLIAVQGPSASKVLASLAPKADFSQIPFMGVLDMEIAGMKTFVSRSGYTGEDGFEICVDNSLACKLWDKLSSIQGVEAAGLGARDTLRLEAGLCLYGNDIDDKTTPNEAGLLWTISARRKESGGFPGFDVIKQQIKDGVKRKRVGFIFDKVPIRAHSKIVDGSGNEIGEITSGSPSPTLGKPIAMGYIKSEHSKIGTNVKVQVRNRDIDSVVSKMPFVPTRYFK